VPSLTPRSRTWPDEELRHAVETGYHHKSYAYRAQRTEELDRLLRRIQPGDLVLTTERGRAYLGEVAGPAYFTDSGHGLSNVRRDVRWLDHGRPLDASRLAPTRVPALLQSQAYVVDLTQAYETPSVNLMPWV
jgi:5-methylcytosine-specific restriction protein B